MSNSPHAAETDPLRDAWESLGIAFVANASGVKHSDPEQTLISTVKEFQDHRKMLKLSLAWLRAYGELVHVERLKSLTRESNAIELAWMGGISSHMIEFGDSRWKALLQMIGHRLGAPSPRFATSKLDELQAQRVGEDPHFKKFGLCIPLTSPAD